ncbi:uncharacterized protein [Amphiura filiformis]|uniref:uncharacterized protein n=1 Tax=Amphiura filiformis TaxID=82378 RepID=UPI003B20FED7
MGTINCANETNLSRQFAKIINRLQKKMAEAAAEVEACDRFPEVNSQELNDIIQQKDSRNTQRSTAGQVNIFRDYLQARNLDTNFEQWSKQQLADTLRKFYIEVRRADGKEYKTGSLINIRAGLNRHLKMKGIAVNIISEPVFAQANLSFAATQAKLKREGLGDTTHYVPIDADDMTKLYESESGVFDVDTPEGLQNKVWFELMFFICRRGRENLRKLEKDHFAIASDANGRRYVYQCKDEMTKKIRGDSMKSRVDDNNTLFQAPIRSRSESSGKPWYRNAPVGEKTLGNFMSKISLAAGLSRRYTNHSLRATCITRLDELPATCSRAPPSPSPPPHSKTGHEPDEATELLLTNSQMQSLMDDCGVDLPVGVMPAVVEQAPLALPQPQQQISTTTRSSNSTMLSSRQDNRNIIPLLHKGQVLSAPLFHKRVLPLSGNVFERALNLRDAA